MRLKSFYAKTMTEAMTMVRQTLGEDAVIVATREENGGRAVRVTAAIEQEDRYASSAVMERPASTRRNPNFEIDTVSAPSNERDDWLQYDDEDEENAVIEQLTDVMLRHSVADEITDQVISCATVMGMESAAVALTATLEHLYSFRPLPQKANSTPLMVVGPPGAGKTLATAKLAARGVMNGLRVGVITTDTVRAGGTEQLAAFTKILRIDLKKAATPRELQALIGEANSLDQILIDTGGMNPFNPEEMRDLARLIGAADMNPILVLPAGIDADESGETARIYATLGVRSLLPTRLDIARRLGGLLSAAHHGSLIFSDASNTPKVADGLLPLSPERLANILLPSSRRNEQTRSTASHRRTKTG